MIEQDNLESHQSNTLEVTEQKPQDLKITQPPQKRGQRFQNNFQLKKNDEQQNQAQKRNLVAKTQEGTEEHPVKDRVKEIENKIKSSSSYNKSQRPAYNVNKSTAQQDNHIKQISEDDEFDHKPQEQDTSDLSNDSTLKNNSAIATYHQRQKLLEQQKQVLQEKQKLSYTSQGVQQNDQYIRNLGQNSSTYNDNDLDLQKLALILGNDNKQTYEPGQSSYQIDSSLPQLQQIDNKIQQHQNNFQQPKIEQQQSINQSESKQQESFVQKQLSEQSSDEDEIHLNEEQHENDNILKEQQIEEDLRKELKQQNDKVLIEEVKESPEKQQIEEVGSVETLDQQQQKKIEQNLEPLDESKNDETKDQENEQSPQKEAPLPSNRKITYPKPLENIPIIDMRNFLTSPSPLGGMIQCTIKRDRSGLARFYPKYHMHLSNGFKYLMTAKKRACNNTSNYLICMSRQDLSKKNIHFLGKVRSNFLGTEFTLYDNGLNPKSTGKNPDKARCQLGMVFYESNILGTKGPRKMKVIMPRIDAETNQPSVYKPLDSKSGVLQDFQASNKDKLMVCINRPPKWNEQVQAFVLNFYGRVDKPSVKNFQLVEEGGEDVILLQFGRVGEDLFNLDFQYPISPLQAFQIALSSFDYKIACE